MSKNKADWHIPSDWVFQLGLLVIIPAIAILAGILLPVLNRLKAANAVD